MWRFEDFRGQSSGAVAKALSRLARSGLIERLGKGLYYRPRQTAFGKSRPNPVELEKLAAERTPIFPAGIAAANHLGFTTQTANRAELATTASSLPRSLVGENTVIHTRRPRGWETLSVTEAALLDFLRSGGRTSELSPEKTARRTLALLSVENRYRRLLRVADTEPPRVRALLGALGERLGEAREPLRRLHATLNPLSRFDFGPFSVLPTARSWQAKVER